MVFYINFPDFKNQIRILQDKENSVSLGVKSYIVNAIVESDKGGNILVGNYSSVAHQIGFILGMNHDMNHVSTYPKRMIGKEGESDDRDNNVENNHYQIMIGHDVWIGRGATIMGGVKIGNGAVIGANAMVAKDVPPYSVVVGNPGRVIKYRFAAEVIRKLQSIKWWYWMEEKIIANRELLRNVEEFVDQFYSDDLLNCIENETVQCLRKYREQGVKTFYFIPDFGWEDSVWEKVISSYFNKYTINDLVALIIDIKSKDKQEYQKDIEQINEWFMRKGEKAPLFIENCEADSISLDVLQNTDVFITTKAYESIKAIDYGWDYGIEIISGLDDDIFYEKISAK